MTAMPDLNYDPAAPLHLTVEAVADRSGVTISRCAYDNAEGDRVSGYLVEHLDLPTTAG